MFELLSKAVVESKQKVNIPKLSKEEPEEKEESEKPKKEKRGALPLTSTFPIPFSRGGEASMGESRWKRTTTKKHCKTLFLITGGGTWVMYIGLQQKEHSTFTLKIATGTKWKLGKCIFYHILFFRLFTPVITSIRS